MDILRDDLPALQACSLTCRVMLASARRLIHQTLYLTPENYNYQSVPTRRYRLRFLKRNHNYFELRFLSYVGERGLLQYTRQVHICMSLTFSPDAILPHLHHFQSLNHVHTLTLGEFNLLRWTSHYQTCFSHFYPTLTSLTLSHCVDYDRLLLQFVLQFPRLESLCVERLWELVNLEVAPPNPTVTVDQPPPLCGHLRLTGGDTLSQLTTYFSREGVNFRSVELEKFPGSRAQPILNACGNTLEYLTIIHNGDGEWELADLSFTGLTTLRRLTLCFPRVFDVFKFKRHFLFKVLSAIQSPFFCELVFEVLGPLNQERIKFDRGHTWDAIDMFLGERCAEREDCRLIFRMEEVNGREIFQRDIMDRFPRLRRRGRIHFE